MKFEEITMDMHTAYPTWLPTSAQHYLDHAISGQSIREIARKADLAPSTILRQIRKYESKRDDPLIDEVFNLFEDTYQIIDKINHNAILPYKTQPSALLDSKKFEAEAPRILNRLNEKNSYLVIAAGLEKAIVAREYPNNETMRTAILDRSIAQALAINNWIEPHSFKTTYKYKITHAGKAILKNYLLENISHNDAIYSFITAQDKEQDQENEQPLNKAKKARIRYCDAESPIAILARRMNADGSYFLTPDLLKAAEKLREDFEVSQIGEKIPRKWSDFLTNKDRRWKDEDARGFGAGASAARVEIALESLGSGLADVALYCCCYLYGMEQVEKKMRWSSRSGKIVLRIALEHLKTHYEKAAYSDLIG